jgi:tight adherence protein C
MQTVLLAMLFAAVFGATWLLTRTLLPGQALRRLQRLSLRQSAPGATATPTNAAVLPLRRSAAASGPWHRLRTMRRRRAAARRFADMLDLLVVCLEAGLGTDAAIARVAVDMAPSAPVLASELQQVARELRAGASREDALRAMAHRTGLAELQTLATVLVQAERFGTGIAASLRVHAADLRLRQRQAAEEKAARLALKMLFPLIFCVFPALLLVLLGPALIQVRQALLPGMGL